METVFREMDAVMLGEGAAFLVVEREWPGWPPGCVLHRVIGGPSIYVEQGEVAWWCHRDGTLEYESPPSRFYEESHQDVLLDDVRAWWEQRQAKGRAFSIEGVQAAHDALLEPLPGARYVLEPTEGSRPSRLRYAEMAFTAAQLREHIAYSLAALHIIEGEEAEC